VLGVHRVSRDGAAYYLADLGQELPGANGARWAGQAAAALGLEGRAEGPGLHRLLEGRHPITSQAMGSGRRQVTAWDLTFSAPKSVSVLFALGGADAARAAVIAHDDAVAGALRYLEGHGVTAVRRRGSESLVLPTSGVVAARVTHAVNRNEDPHLHSHVVVANLVHGADGRWSACDRRGLEAHRAAADAVYQAHLRAGLTSSVGVRWSAAPGRVPEVLGVPPVLLGEFASRAAEIRRHRHERGATSARGARVAWAVTRAPKPVPRPLRALSEEWTDRARVLGVDVLELDRRRDPRARLVDEHRFAHAASLTPHGGMRRRDVTVAFAGAARDGVDEPALARLVDSCLPEVRVGVDEVLHPRRSAVPANHLLGILGPRPLRPDDHEVWVRAADAIEGYRHRWELPGTVDLVGPLRSPASVPTARLVDHLRTARSVEMACMRMDRGRTPVGVERGLIR
jgi:conjugative relaxase-like TrwC/TraI family protein